MNETRVVMPGTIAVALVLIAGIASRIYMAWILGFTALSSVASSIILCGALRDMALVFVVISLLNLHRRLSSWAAVIVPVLLILTLASTGLDLVYFYFTFSRIEAVVFDNINATSIRGVLTFKALAGGVLIATALGVMGWWYARYYRRASTGNSRWFYWAGGALLALILAGPVCSYLNPVRPDDEPAEGLDDFIARSQARNLQGVLRSPVLNLAGELYKYFAAEAEARTLPTFLLTPGETEVLEKEMGLQLREPASSHFAPTRPVPYRTIIILAVESLHRDYLHYYNPAIPEETTPFLDTLLARYPRLDHYYCSAMPTNFGLNAMLMSRLRLPSQSEYDRLRPHSLFERLKSLLGPRTKSYMIRGESIHYSNAFFLHKKLFGVDELIAKEQLLARYEGPDVASGWGVHDPYLYKEVLRILRERNGLPTVIFNHNIDMHQPGSYAGLEPEEIPKGIAQHGESILTALRWMDDCLKDFFLEMEREGLFNEDTLVVITADHSPHPGEEAKRWVHPENFQRLAPIPLIFVSKNLEPFMDWNSGRLASQVDFAPTLAGLEGGAERVGDFGGDLLANPKREVALGFYDREIFLGTKALKITVPFVRDPSKLFGEAGATQNVRTLALNKWLRNLEAMQ